MHVPYMAQLNNPVPALADWELAGDYSQECADHRHEQIS